MVVRGLADDVVVDLPENLPFVDRDGIFIDCCEGRRGSGCEFFAPSSS